MPRLLTLATAALIALAPVPARAGALELRLGGFFPRADSTLFQTTPSSTSSAPATGTAFPAGSSTR